MPNVRLDSELHAQLVAMSKKTGRPVQTLVHDAVVAYLGSDETAARPNPDAYCQACRAVQQGVRAIRDETGISALRTALTREKGPV